MKFFRIGNVEHTVTVVGEETIEFNRFTNGGSFGATRPGLRMPVVNIVLDDGCEMRVSRNELYEKAAATDEKLSDYFDD